MKSSMKCIVVLLVCLAVCWPAATLVINVPVDQPTIQDGILAASAGDTVLVADGVYLENIDFLGKAITVTSVNGPASTTIDGSGTGFGVLVTFHGGEGLDSLLEGFTITNGSTGIYCLGHDTYLTSPTLRDNIITGNSERGIECAYSAALIEQNMITGNSRGGIFCEYSYARIDQNVISGNNASSGTVGGGIRSDLSDLEITRNTISDNDGSDGAGIYIDSSSLTPPHNRLVIIGNQISGNIASGDGGGIHLHRSTPNIFVHDNTITDNEAGDNGGGIYARLGQIIFSGNRISGNSAYKGGGGYLWECELATFHNNLIDDNTAQRYGGGLAFLGCLATLETSTIIGNQALVTNGGGIYAVFSQLSMTNNILFFNSAHFADSKEIMLDTSGLLQLSYCDVEGGQSSVSVPSPGNLEWGPGMIDADPLFVDGSFGQYCLSQTAAGQAVDSPCLDTGSDLASAVGHETTLGTVTMDQMTTRTDQLADSGTVDLGWHNKGWPSNTIDAGLSCEPSAGTLPLTTQFSASLQNRYLSQTRRIAVKVDATLGGGASYANWRAGWTNIDRGVTFTISWPQNFPAFGVLVGANQFSLTAMDVTPAPFNQPPYPPAGDTATGSGTVTGVAP